MLTPSDLLDTEDLAQLLGVASSSLRAMRSQPERHRKIDGLPEPLRLISGRPCWERRAIERWAGRRAKAVGSTYAAFFIKE